MFEKLEFSTGWINKVLRKKKNAQVKIWGGIPPFPPGIPGVSQVGSRLGLWNILCGIPPGIMEHSVWSPTRDVPIPLGIPPQISDSFPPGKSYCRRDCTWDPANISFDILGKILRGILPNTRDHRVIKYTRKNILPISLEPNPSN